MFVLQAHPSSCSQQGPTWPCLLSRRTATATQQHQATASRHSPASVMACEHPRARTPPPVPPIPPSPPHHHDFTRHLPSICPSLFVFLTSFPWSSTHNRGHKQATAHSRFEYYFFIMLSCYKRKTFNCIEGLLFVLFEKKSDHTSCFFVLHIPYL